MSTRRKKNAPPNAPENQKAAARRQQPRGSRLRQEQAWQAQRSGKQQAAVYEPRMSRSQQKVQTVQRPQV
jgi:hypothetical protein